MPKLPDDSKRKQELLDHLVGNCKCDGEPQFSQDDVEVLNKFDIDQLDRLADEPKEQVVNEELNQEIEEPVVNSETPKFDEALLPDSVKEELQFARNMMQKEKDSLVEKITVNKDCAFSKEELSEKSVDELRKIASLVGNQADPEEQPIKVTPRLGGNVRIDNKEQPLEALELPVMNFGN